MASDTTSHFNLAGPLNRKLIATNDSDSYKTMNPYTETGLPLLPHPGAFAAQRRHHQHEGIDLYGQEDELVYAMTVGTVVAIYRFTGESVGMPWWNETSAVAIEDDTGIWVYGEITPDCHLSVGSKVLQDQIVGRLTTVLRHDKGRPMTMLHLERWVSGSKPYTRNWLLNTNQPTDMVDPTPLLTELI